MFYHNRSPLVFLFGPVLGFAIVYVLPESLHRLDANIGGGDPSSFGAALLYMMLAGILPVWALFDLAICSHRLSREMFRQHRLARLVGPTKPLGN